MRQFTFQASVSEPENCADACASSALFSFLFDAYALEATDWVTGRFVVNSVDFELLDLQSIETLRFLGLSLEEGQTADVELLLGDVPEVEGSGGVFPLAAPGTLTFQLVSNDEGVDTVRATVSTSFLTGDSLFVCRNKINAAAALVSEGVTAIALVTELKLVGDIPGASESIVITQAFAGLGFATTGRWQGTGTPTTFDRVCVETFSDNPIQPLPLVWLAGGPATLRYFAAGD